MHSHHCVHSCPDHYSMMQLSLFTLVQTNRAWFIAITVFPLVQTTIAWCIVITLFTLVQTAIAWCIVITVHTCPDCYSKMHSHHCVHSCPDHDGMCQFCVGLASVRIVGDLYGGTCVTRRVVCICCRWPMYWLEVFVMKISVATRVPSVLEIFRSGQYFCKRLFSVLEIFRSGEYWRKKCH